MPRDVESILRRPAVPAVLLVLLLVASCAEADPPDPAAQELIGELEAELDHLRDRVEALEQDNEALEDELAAMRDASPEDHRADDDANNDADDDERAPIEWPSEVASLWTTEGLVDQLRVHLRQADSEAEMPEGWQPGVTAWMPYEGPDALGGADATPGEVMAELAAVTDAALLGRDQWEVTIRVLFDEDDPDLAYGVLLGWGFLDDSVVGRDIRVTLSRTDDERWEHGGAEQRQHCMRGVSDDQSACL